MNEKWYTFVLKYWYTFGLKKKNQYNSKIRSLKSIRIEIFIVFLHDYVQQ